MDTNAQLTDMANKEGLRRVLAMLVGGASVGMLGRGIVGLGQAAQHRTLPAVNPQDAIYASLNEDDVDKNHPGSWMQLPGPQVKTKGARPSLFKAAGEPLAPTAPPVPIPEAPKPSNPLQWTADKLYDNVIKPSGLNNLMDLPLTGNTTNPNAKYWQNAGMLGAGVLGVGGGWKLMDWLHDKQQENEDDSDVRAAEQEYMDTIKQLHSKAAMLKGASERIKQAEVDVANPAGAASPTPAQPDLKIPSLSFTSGDPQDFRNTYPGQAANMWGLTAMLAGIPSAAAIYHYMRNSSQNKAVQEALFHRQRLLQKQQPSAVQFKLPSASSQDDDDTDAMAV